MFKNVIKMLCLEICLVSDNLAIHNDSEFLSLNPVPGLQIQSGEVLHPDVGSIFICELSPDFNFSVGKVFCCLFKFEFSAFDSAILIFSFFGHQLLPKYEKSLKPVVFVCGKEATPGFCGRLPFLWRNC